MQRRHFLKSAVGGALVLRAPGLFALQASSKAPDPEPDVKRVLVMFKCHFDAGFVDTQTAVVHKYFKEYFPRAIEVAEQLRRAGGQRYVWATCSWVAFGILKRG